MCRYCVEYGDGTKWYLNPKNYTSEVLTASPHAEAVAALGGAGKNTFEMNIAAGADGAVPDVNYPDLVNMVLENVLNHAGQVVPIEDALKVVDLSFDAYDVPWLKQHCTCRKYFGLEPIEVCLYSSRIAETSGAGRPWETDQKRLDRNQVKEHLKQMSKARMVHSLWHGGVAQDGIPVLAICSCAYPDCMGIRAREVYGAMNAMRKGEYVARIRSERCAEGCGSQERQCMPWCHFGALRYSATHKHVFVVPQRCFGCGNCRNVCPHGAVEWMNRLDYPGLVDAW
jgi:NAD-dependent dihydropyrimidine dehydrogenase PreA subunit